MSYFVTCTFDLKQASAIDYQNAYTDLNKIGLKRTVVATDGKAVVAPTTMAMGQFNGASASGVCESVRDQVLSAFRADVSSLRFSWSLAAIEPGSRDDITYKEVGMTTDAMTNRQKVRFRVKEFGDGTPWLYLEGESEERDGFFGMDLASGTTYEQAQEIAKFLNTHVPSVTLTRTFNTIKQERPF